MANRHMLFISYQRSDLPEVRELDQILRANGVWAWRDLEYLPPGQATIDVIRNAIDKECRGFVYYVTSSSLKSEFIWKYEIPAAYERSRREGEPFPLIPIFRDSTLIAAFRRKSFKAVGVDLSNRNGFVLKPGALNRVTLLDIAQKLIRELVSYDDYTPVELITQDPLPTRPRGISS